MIHAADTNLTASFASSSWLRQTFVPVDILATLSERLGAPWHVHREIDCEGEVSIIVFPGGDDDDDETLPVFILYEKNGLAHVATVEADEWKTAQDFASIQGAADAIALWVADCPRREASPAQRRG